MNKLLVFCLDALCSFDLEQMKELSNFAPLFENGAVVRKVEPVYPSLTYPCHTSILTGTYVKKHGIAQNEMVSRGAVGSPWYNMKQQVKAKTLLDYAKDHGLSTCSLSWPVSGGAAYDFNMPMIIPYHYHGYEPEQYLRGTATANLMDEYWWKYGRFLKGNGRNLDAFTMAVAGDLLRDFGQPDVMLVKMCDLDSARHRYGVYSEEAAEQLQTHNEEFGVLLESVRRYGEFDRTNFVVLGDHGQSDVETVLNMNVLLREHGFIRLNEQGTLESYDALCHSAGLSAWIELFDPSDEAMKNKVRNFLNSLREDPKIRLKYLFEKQEAEQLFGLTGLFDFIVESENPLSFWEDLTAPEVFREHICGDKKAGEGSHGGLPTRTETTAFLAAGPAVKAGAVMEQAGMVDEAPTMARMLGFDMPDTDGKVLSLLLNETNMR